MNNGERAIQIVVEFDKGLLQHFDVDQWNAFVNGLFEQVLLAACWSPSERPPLLVMLLDFKGLRRAHYHLDGIDLRLCWLQDADFTRASLRGAKLGCGRDISYRGARLHCADFRHVEISGCDFSGATGLDTAHFDGTTYDPENPPKGLPQEILAYCTPNADPPPTNCRQRSNPQEPMGFQQAPIRCCATIHRIPIGD